MITNLLSRKSLRFPLLHFWLGFLVALLCLVFTSCVDLEETITIKADGSATYQLVFEFTKEFWQEELGGIEQMDEMQLEEIEENFASLIAFYGDGVTLESVEAKERIGGKGAIIAEYQIEDINTFRQYGFFEIAQIASMGADDAEMVQEIMKEGSISTGTRFRLEEQNLTVISPLRLVAAPLSDVDQLNFFIQQADGLEGSQTRQVLKLADGLVNTDATHVENQEILLLELSFDTLFESERLNEFLISTPSTETMDFTKLKALNEIKGISAEPKAKFTVELKPAS